MSIESLQAEALQILRIETVQQLDDDQRMQLVELSDALYALGSRLPDNTSEVPKMAIHKCPVCRQDHESEEGKWFDMPHACEKCQRNCYAKFDNLPAPRRAYVAALANFGELSTLGPFPVGEQVTVLNWDVFYPSGQLSFTKADKCRMAEDPYTAAVATMSYRDLHTRPGFVVFHFDDDSKLSFQKVYILEP